MNQWASPADIKQLLLKKWQQGQFLAEALEPSGLFPFRLPLKSPTSAQLSEHYHEVKTWIQTMQTLSGSGQCGLEWREVNNRLIGRNQLPVAVLFFTLEQAAAFLNKSKELRQFKEDAGLLLQHFPVLKTWVCKYPHKILEQGENWPRIVTVLNWLASHPKPHCYLRPISLSGIDTKFIERHKKLLAELLDILLVPEHTNKPCNSSQFEQRYGFLTRPVQIRFRILDTAYYLHGLSDLAVPAEEFCRLNIAVDTVFITENDVNGLAFPAHPKAIVIFGRGYGFEYLAQAAWLNKKTLWYWGDIDTHGFAILSQFRRYFPHTRSLLMDKPTLLAHEAHWGKEDKPTFADLPNLSEAEAALYDDLGHNRIAVAVRLEQEHIAFDKLTAVLKDLGLPSSAGNKVQR